MTNRDLGWERYLKEGKGWGWTKGQWFKGGKPTEEKGPLMIEPVTGGQERMTQEWRGAYPGIEPPELPGEYKEPLTPKGWEFYYRHPTSTTRQLYEFEAQFVPGMPYLKGSEMYEMGFRSKEEYMLAQKKGLIYGPHGGTGVPTGGLILTDEKGQPIGRALVRDVERASSYISKGQFILPPGGIASLPLELREVFADFEKRGIKVGTGVVTDEIPEGYATESLMSMPFIVLAGRTHYDISKIAADPELSSQFEKWHEKGAEILAAYRKAMTPPEEITPSEEITPPPVPHTWEQVVDIYLTAQISEKKLSAKSIKELRSKMLASPEDYQELVSRHPATWGIWRAYKRQRTEAGIAAPTPVPTGPFTSVEEAVAAFSGQPVIEMPKKYKETVGVPDTIVAALNRVGWAEMSAYGSIVTDEAGNVLSQADLTKLYFTDPTTKVQKVWFLGGDVTATFLSESLSDLIDMGVQIIPQQELFRETTAPFAEVGAKRKQVTEWRPPEEKPPIEKKKVDIAKLQTALSPFRVTVLPDYPYLSPLPREAMFRIPPDILEMMSEYLMERGMDFNEFLSLSGAFYKAGAPAERWAVPGR